MEMNQGHGRESMDALCQTNYSWSALLLLFIIWHHQRYIFNAVWVLHNADKDMIPAWDGGEQINFRHDKVRRKGAWGGEE